MAPRAMSLRPLPHRKVIMPTYVDAWGARDVRKAWPSHQARLLSLSRARVLDSVQSALGRVFYIFTGAGLITDGQGAEGLALQQVGLEEQRLRSRRPTETNGRVSADGLCRPASQWMARPGLHSGRPSLGPFCRAKLTRLSLSRAFGARAGSCSPPGTGGYEAGDSGPVKLTLARPRHFDYPWS